MPPNPWSSGSDQVQISPKSGYAPLTVKVSAPALITQMTGSELAVDWGDGANGGLSHTFHSPGAYLVSVTRTGPRKLCGADRIHFTNNYSETINVLDPYPNDPQKYFKNCTEKPSQFFKQDKKTWSNALEVRLSVNIKYPQRLEYFLDWGDGTLEKKEFVPGPRAVLPASSMQFKHTYRERGKYTVRFRSNNYEPAKHAKDVLYYEKLDISI